MEKKVQKKNNYLTIFNLILFSLTLPSMIFCLNSIEWYMQVIGYGAIVLFTFSSIIFNYLNKVSLSRTAFILNLVAFFIIGGLTILNLFGLFENFSNIDDIKKLILDSGSFGYLVYVTLQLLNVVILPLPGFIFIIAGIAIFGAETTFYLTVFSFILGSIISFYIGRIFGQKAVNWCIGEDLTNKYKNLLGKKGDLLFAIMQFLPFFPDDILCMVAGLTSMKFSYLLVIILIAKPLYVGTVCFLGSSTILPFSGWGIPIWILIFAIIIVGFIAFCKYQNKIENFLQSITSKRKKGKTKSKNK